MGWTTPWTQSQGSLLQISNCLLLCLPYWILHASEERLTISQMMVLSIQVDAPLEIACPTFHHTPTHNAMKWPLYLIYSRSIATYLKRLTLSTYISFLCSNVRCLCNLQATRQNQHIMQVCKVEHTWFLIVSYTQKLSFARVYLVCCCYRNDCMRRAAILARYDTPLSGCRWFSLTSVAYLFNSSTSALHFYTVCWHLHMYRIPCLHVIKLMRQWCWSKLWISLWKNGGRPRRPWLTQSPFLHQDQAYCTTYWLPQ